MRTQSYFEMKRICNKFANLVLEAFKSFNNCTSSRTHNTSMCRINLHNRSKVIYCILLWKGIHVLYSLYTRNLTTVCSKEWAGTWYFMVNFIAWLWKETFLTSFNFTKYILQHLFCLKTMCIVLHGTRTMCIVLHGIRTVCIVLHGIELCVLFYME